MDSLPVFQSIPEYYHQELQEGFRLYPKRRDNYERYLRSGAKLSVVDYQPIKLDVENVSRCNYHCIMCQVSDWPGRKRAGDMDLPSYKALIDAQDGLIQVKIQGMGEPTLDPSYPEMISYARRKRLWVRSITNGSLLDRNENYIRILEADINELFISIDGASNRSYEKIRRGGNFEKVCANARLINQRAQNLRFDRTLMWVVVQQDNLHELDVFPQLASALGFRRLTFSLDLHYFGKESLMDRNKTINVSGRVSLQKAQALVEQGKALGVEVSFWLISAKYNASNPCPWPFERLYASSDLRIVPCSVIATPEVKDLGDARHLGSEWNGPLYQEFREAHLRGHIPACCKLCYEGK